MTVVLLGAGCEFKGTVGAVVDGGEGWRPEAEALRVYPGTRFVEDEDRVLLEVRVELLDAMDDPVKASGQYRFELFEPGTGEQTIGARDTVWEIDVTGVADHEAHYDPVTRAYFFRLALDEALPARSRFLRITFMPADDTPRLEGEAHVPGVRR